MPATEYACPLCPQDNPGQIMAGSGSLQCAMNPAHVWNDVKTFVNLAPRKVFTVPQAVFPAQTGHVKFDVMLPLGIKTAIETKYGPKADATIAQIVSMLAEGDVLPIPSQDLDRMKQKFNKRPESSGELFGMMYDLDLQALNAKQSEEYALKQLEAYKGRNPDMVLIDLGAQLQRARDKANSASEPFELWLSKMVITAIENDWF